MSSNVSRYSNAKHWCTICRIFTQNDPKSIQMHEQGLRHVGAVKRRLERAARLKDAGSSSSSAAQQQMDSSQMSVKEIEKVTLRPDEILGQYMIRGTIYLQGDYHEDLLLQPFCQCQVSLLDEDGEPGSWISCKVRTYNAVEQVYEVVYKSTKEDGTEVEESAHVAPSDIRIIGPIPPAANQTAAWTSVSSSSANEPAVEDNDEEEEHQQQRQVEYYKGVAVMEDDAEAQQLISQEEERKPANATGPVVFKKRFRPGRNN